MKRSLGRSLEIKKNRLKRRSSHIFREVTVALSVIGVSAFLGMMMMYSYNFILCSDYFRLEETTVKGAYRLSGDEVIRLSGVTESTNMLTANLHSMVSGIQAHPWVKEVRMTRVLPGGLVIEIEEREPLALIRHEQNLYLMDQEGIIFKNLDQNDRVDLPVMTGFSDGGSLDQDLVRGAMEIMEYLDSRSGYPEIRHVSEIRADQVHGFSLCTLDHRLYVLGFGDYETKFRRLRNVLFDLTTKNANLSPLLVDLADPGRVVVRQGAMTGPGLQDRGRRTDI